jgi:hypothetical protein
MLMDLAVRRREREEGSALRRFLVEGIAHPLAEALPTSSERVDQLTYTARLAKPPRTARIHCYV